MAALKQQAGVDVQTATLRLKQDQGQVQAFEARLRSATVTALLDGTLYSLPVRVGDYLKVGDVLAEMADLRQVRVRAFVDEPDLGWLAPGEDVQVNWDAMPNRTWTGKVEHCLLYTSFSCLRLICAIRILKERNYTLFVSGGILSQS